MSKKQEEFFAIFTITRDKKFVLEALFRDPELAAQWASQSGLDEYVRSAVVIDSEAIEAL